MKRNPSPAERWEQGIDHDPRSVRFYEAIARFDAEQNNDYFGFKAGGDGDNGEMLMYLFDMYFTERDEQAKQQTSKEMQPSSTSDAELLKKGCALFDALHREVEKHHADTEVAECLRKELDDIWVVASSKVKSTLNKYARALDMAAMKFD